MIEFGGATLENITVIVPIYNMEKRLSLCIQSLLNQKTYRKFTYVIMLIDDGSTDASGEICDSFKKKYSSKIIVFHEKNSGVSAARNFAIKRVNTKYISFADPDDYVSPYYLLHLYETLKKDNADLSVCGFQEIWNNDRPTFSEYIKGYQVLDTKEAIRKLLYQRGVDFSVWGKLIKSEYFKDNYFPLNKRYEDVPVTFNLFVKSKKVSFISNNDYVYWQRNDSMLNSKFNNKKLDIIPILENLMEQVNENFPELGSAVSCRYFAGMSNVYFQVPNDIEESNTIWSSIAKVRKKVLFDKEASFKVRMGALCTYFGPKFFKYIYKKTQKRGKVMQLSSVDG